MQDSEQHKVVITFPTFMDKTRLMPCTITLGLGASYKKVKLKLC